MQPEKRLADVAAAYGVDSHWLHVRIIDLFGFDDFSGQRVLDVGAGRGLHACAIAALGAAEVVALEPEMEGSRAGVTGIFRQNVESLGLQNVRLLTAPLEAFRAEPESFDRVLMYAVINHIDEAHVQTLDRDPDSRRIYIQHLTPVLNWLRPGGQLVAFDAARSHIFTPLIRAGLLRQHPRFPTIAWEKHQNPEVWAAVLRQAGFRDVHYHWAAFTRHDWIRATLGRLTMLNRLILAHFVLRATR